MRKLFFTILALQLISVNLFAKEVKVCNILSGAHLSTMKLACEGSTISNTSTLKEMYKKGWRFVGTTISGSGGHVIILEK